MAEEQPDEAEEWRPVVGWEDYYEVSNLGRVRSLERLVVDRRGSRRVMPGRVRKQVPQVTGHLTVLLSGTTRYLARVHRLVAEAFNGPCPDGMECRHLDGDPQNNRPGNLQWGTRLENQHDRWAHGTHNKGERHGMSKLTDGQVQEMRELRAGGMKLAALAERFHVGMATVSNVCSGKRWQHCGDGVDREAVLRITVPRGEKSRTAKLNPEKVREIRKLAATGMRQVDIAARFGVGQPCISSVLRGAQWSEVTDEEAA